jgi:hypothetical protein
MPYKPVTDGEWTYLLRRFAGLHGGSADERGRTVARSQQELRQLFNEGLSNSPQPEDVRRRSRTIVRERARSRSVEVYNDPYFELEWERAATADPRLRLHENLSESRAALWDGYYRRDDQGTKREQAQRRWHAATREKTRPEDFVYEET